MKYVCLLRGINVGGKRKILMADLKELITKLGVKEVTTYIQSGNVVFNSGTELNEKEFENTLQQKIKEHYDFDVPVMLINEVDYRDIISKQPFNQDDINKLHVGFLGDLPLDENITHLSEVDAKEDRFEVKKKALYLYCEGKYHQTKLTHAIMERRLKVDVTVRNWKTVLKLDSMLVS
ncbi:DUF1697 domain-containing protein [Flammeovirga agarivorans]|uniref:DUF1697 domain-containing protein n=1 Tax=Flammeovirga agarivorans TaxID=2726742 RepID=A0A7X8SHI3_9BACT|nr:DUF1697 domain-containing protein [Flammeovirga agarivorans]NLR90232.1 DUF1697 domain-containing protein [Flammeovirga agarivorans]